MGVAPSTKLEMQRDRRRMDERAPELFSELRLEGRVAQWPGLLQVDVVMKIGAAGEVERDLDESFVERHRDRREAADAHLRAQRLAERLAEDDAGVLDRVVCVHLEVAPGLHVQIHAPVPAELRQHVVEERQARGCDRLPGPVELEDDDDFGLPRRAFPLGATGVGARVHSHSSAFHAEARSRDGRSTRPAARRVGRPTGTPPAASWPHAAAMARPRF